MKYILFCTVVLISSLHLRAQVGGCTDPLGSNYTTTATFNNGSCTYADSMLLLTKRGALPTTLDELSGLIYYNGKLYGHQDSGGPAAIYEIDTSTLAITKTIMLQGITNVDWEDMTQSNTHIFIADTGNNVNGNRRDLTVYKFPKSAITAGTTISIPSTQIEKIEFAYEDQTDFTAKGANNTSYDCEAIIYSKGKLHLFTKNWIGTTTTHYVLPTSSGTYMAKKKETYDTGVFKITGAAYGANDLIALVGYQTDAPATVRLILVYGFDGTYNYLTRGAVRAFSIGSILSEGQVEAICFRGPLELYVGNERFSAFGGVINVDQSIYKTSILDLIRPYYRRNQIQYSGTSSFSPGVLRYNDTWHEFQGYDGTHWVTLGKK